MKEGNNYSIELIDKDCTIKGELYKIIDQWYNLTKHDFSRRRFITV